MKPRSPKKRDVKPNCKTGEVKEELSYPELLIGFYHDNQPKMTMIIKSNIGTFALYDDGTSKKIED